MLLDNFLNRALREQRIAQKHLKRQEHNGDT